MCANGADVNGYGYVEELATGQGTPANVTNIYQAIVFGDAFYGFAESLPVELRDNGVEDFGRKRSLGWYSIFGTGILHDAYGVRIESA